MLQSSNENQVNIFGAFNSTFQYLDDLMARVVAK